MSQFLVAVPVDPRHRRATDVGDALTTRLLETVARSYTPFLGQAYTQPRRIDAAGPSAQVLAWSHDFEGPRLAQNSRRWAVTAGSPVEVALAASLSERGGRLSYAQPVWGTYAVVTGSAERPDVAAWNTTPALEAIHYGRSRTHVYLSNRPLLVALTLAGGSARNLRLSDEYVSEYLLYGYSVTGQTPFDGVQTLPPRQSLRLSDGALSFVEIPPGLGSTLAPEHTADEGADALVAALESSARRAFDEIGDRPVQLRLSGGNDSRLLLALSRGHRDQIRSLTFGSDEDRDVKLARILAQMSDVDHTVSAPRWNDGDTLAERVLDTLRFSGGIPSSEAHVAMYQAADPASPDEVAMLGHWPLWKGGMARHQSLTDQAIDNTIIYQGNAILNSRARKPYDAFLRGWMDTSDVSSRLELLYMYGRDFRSGRWLQGHMSHYANSAQLSYFLSDAEATAVSDALTMPEMVTNTVLYKTLERLWPECLTLPLAGRWWPFDPDKKLPIIPFEDLDQHYPLPPSPPVDRPKATEYSVETAIALARDITRFEQTEHLQSLLRGDIRDALGRAAGGRFSPPHNVQPRMLIKYFWRLYVIGQWSTRAWIPAEARAATPVSTRPSLLVRTRSEAQWQLHRAKLTAYRVRRRLARKKGA